MISYAPMWETMRRKKVTQYALIHTYHISPAQITRLKRNEGVSTHTPVDAQRQGQVAVILHKF